MSYELNDKQKAQLNKPFAQDALRSLSEMKALEGKYQTGSYRIEMFHKRVELPVRDDWSYIPPVSERILRAKLLLEEVVETITATGLAIYYDGAPINFKSAAFEIEHVEGSFYDPIEVADGLADVKVIANGTAACFGIPIDEVDYEVWCSNMTKVGADGKAIVNQCNVIGCMSGKDGLCAPTHLIDPTQPVGKVLKPATYCPANIARLYVEQTIKQENES